MTWWALLTKRSRALSARTALGKSAYQSPGERLEVEGVPPMVHKTLRSSYVSSDEM
jgi:hypothetical protein